MGSYPKAIFTCSKRGKTARTQRLIQKHVRHSEGSFFFFAQPPTHDGGPSGCRTWPLRPDREVGCKKTFFWVVRMAEMKLNPCHTPSMCSSKM